MYGRYGETVCGLRSAYCDFFRPAGADEEPAERFDVAVVDVFGIAQAVDHFKIVGRASYDVCQPEVFLNSG